MQKEVREREREREREGERNFSEGNYSKYAKVASTREKISQARLKCPRGIKKMFTRIY